MPIPSSPDFPEFDYQEPTTRNPPVPEVFKPTKPGAIVPYQHPGDLRQPQPRQPPVTQPNFPPSSPPRSRPSTGGRIAGGFRMPPSAAGAAARAGGRGLGRLLPGIGWGLAAYDAYQLGCALGLLPHTICPRPDNPLPGGTEPGFKGGQCPVHYGFVFTLPNGRTVRTKEQGIGCIGPIRSLYVDLQNTGTTPPFDKGWYIIVVAAQPDDIQVIGPKTYRYMMEYEAYGKPTFRGIETYNPNNSDDIPLDNCGDPSPQPGLQRPPDSITNITNITVNVPAPRLPPSPNPRRPPIIINPPNPLPDININIINEGDNPDIDITFNFNPQPTINIGDQIDIDINFPVRPQPGINQPNPVPTPSPSPGPAPSPRPRPELPPPLPDTLPPDATDSDKYNFRLGKEILDKLYRANSEILEIQETLAKQNRVLDNLQSLLDIELEGGELIKRCDGIDTFYSYKDKALKAINKQLDHLKKIEQTVINEVCNVDKESILAAPDWWQIRLKGDVPQIALVFRRGLTRTYYKLTIPHPLNTNKPNQPPIEEYRKGNWQVMIICLDNSKFLANCATREEAERVGNIALSLIHPDYKGLNPRLYFAERKGVAVEEADMYATSALYFPQGVQNTMPAWRVAFKLDGK